MYSMWTECRTLKAKFHSEHRCLNTLQGAGDIERAALRNTAINIDKELTGFRYVT
jgi:hypothetical protein